MSGTLIVWKAPVVRDEDDAERLLRGYYETGDETAFEPSADVARFYDELIERYPALEEIDADARPTWASTPERSSRIVAMDYSWSASDELLDDIQHLARKHGLVLYDPQGPDVFDPNEPEPEPFVPDAREVLRVLLTGIVAVAIAVGAWLVSITVVSWIVIVVTGLVALMAALTLFDYARAEIRRRSRRSA